MKKFILPVFLVVFFVGTTVVYAQFTTTEPEPAPVVEPVPEPTSTPETEPVEETVAPTDSTGPIISGVMSASLGITDATIVWNTDEPATSRIRYGTSESLGQTESLGTQTSLMHTATLTGLSADTTYHYCIDATDVAGNASESCGHTFATVAEPVAADTNPPTVTSVSVSNVSNESATISWTTDEPSDSQVEFGTTVEYGSVSTRSAALSTEHSITLTGLSADTEYHYRVVSADAPGNTGYSFDEIFTTGITPGSEPSDEEAVQQDEPAIETTPEATTTPPTTGTTESQPAPAPVQFSFIEVAHVGTSTVTVTWMTDVRATTQLSYGENVLLGSTSPINSALTISHSVTLTKLESGTNYIFRARSKAEDAELATRSGEHEFNTLVVPVLIETSSKTGVPIESEAGSSTKPSTGGTSGSSSSRRSSSGGGSGQSVPMQALELVQTLPTYHFVEHYVQGDQDIEIEHLQQILIRENVYPQGLVTGYFGPLTQAALVRFQAKHNLPQTGEVSPFTRDKLNAVSQTQVRLTTPVHPLVLASDLEQGATGEAVTRLQNFLIRANSYPEALITGYFGPLTLQAVKVFQAAHHIQPISGYVGPKTRHVMETISGI